MKPQGNNEHQNSTLQGDAMMIGMKELDQSSQKENSNMEDEDDEDLLFGGEKDYEPTFVKWSPSIHKH